MNRVYKSEAAARDIAERYAALLQRWPVANEQLRLTTRQGETFVIASGPAEAPPLILLHGSLANSTTWMGDVACWAKRFRVYAVDVIGEPGFSAPSRPPFKGDAHAAWLDDVLDGLGVGRAAFVGMSLGGWITLDYAIRRSERVTAVAAVCPASVGRQKIGVLLKVVPLLICGGRSKASEIVLGSKALDAAPPEFTALMDAIFRGARPRATALPIFSDADLARLTMPVLAIVGAKDALIRSAETKTRLERIGATVKWLDCGHLITGQTETIAAFLERV
jgi:Predicted hydrolases or acyltransferases (alpha/beta hydrolase superfamily)